MILILPLTFPLLFAFVCVCLFFYGEQNEAKTFPQKFSVSKVLLSLTFHFLLSVPWPSSFMYHSYVPRPSLADKSERAGRPMLSAVACKRLRTRLTSKHRLFFLHLVLFPLHFSVSSSTVKVSTVGAQLCIALKLMG